MSHIFFLSDYLSFVKRILSLSKSYSDIQLLEIEIRPFEESDTPIDVRGRPLTHAAGGATMVRRTVSLIAQPSTLRQNSATSLQFVSSNVNKIPEAIASTETNLSASSKEGLDTGGIDAIASSVHHAQADNGYTKKMKKVKATAVAVDEFHQDACSPDDNKGTISGLVNFF